MRVTEQVQIPVAQLLHNSRFYKTKCSQTNVLKLRIAAANFSQREHLLHIVQLPLLIVIVFVISFILFLIISYFIFTSYYTTPFYFCKLLVIFGYIDIRYIYNKLFFLVIFLTVIFSYVILFLLYYSRPPDHQRTGLPVRIPDECCHEGMREYPHPLQSHQDGQLLVSSNTLSEISNTSLFTCYNTILS